MPTDSAQRHLSSLRAAFDFARASLFTWDQGANQGYVNQVRFVRDCIAKGIPCGDGPAALLEFFLNSSWSGHGDVHGLWLAYAAAGYIEPNTLQSMFVTSGPLKAQAKNNFVQVLPLEMAATLGNVRAYQALLDCGARAELLPSKQWKNSKAPLTLFGFLKHVAKNDVVLSGLQSSTARAIGALPLEASIFEGDLPAFLRLIESGEDVTAVPSRQWIPASGGSKPKAMDTIGFIKFACKGTELREQFSAVATKALMDALIARGGSAPAPIASAPLEVMVQRKPCQASGAHSGTVDTMAQRLLSGEVLVAPQLESGLDSARLAAPEQPAAEDCTAALQECPRSTPRMRRQGL